MQEPQPTRNAKPQLGPQVPKKSSSLLGTPSTSSATTTPTWHNRGYLPHFDSSEKIQSITFRLADSLPQEKLAALEEEPRGKPTQQAATERSQRIEAWLDSGIGCCALKHPQLAKTLQETLLKFDGTRYQLIAWCIMPNHVHVLIKPKESLGKIVQSWKSYTGRWALDRNAELGLGVPSSAKSFWMREYRDRYIRDEEHFHASIKYIHENPVKAGLCREATDWPFSSATRNAKPQPGKQLADPHLPWLPQMLQTTDPLFPIGSYAHSYGLEELCAAGDVQNEETLLHYIRTIVFLNLQEFELPYLRFTYEAALSGDIDSICLLDQEIAASKPCKELRQASASQGQQRLRLISKLRPSPLFDSLLSLKRAKRITPHHITVFAAENVDLRTPLEPTLSSWTYQSLAAPCAASLKLIRIGQEGAQTVLTKALQEIQAIVDNSLTIEREFAGAFLPTLDIASQRHEQAFSRLFIS